MISRLPDQEMRHLPEGNDGLGFKIAGLKRR